MNKNPAAAEAGARTVIPAGELQAKVEKATAEAAPGLAEGARAAAGEVKPANRRTAAIEDATERFKAREEAAEGRVVVPNTYRHSGHAAELATAEKLVTTFGGRLTLKTEVNQDKIKTPDFEWDGKDWELKTCSTEKATDSAMRKAMLQIEKNPGGIVLDYGNLVVDEARLEQAIKNRFARKDSINTIKVIILRNGLQKVYELKK